MKRKVLAVLFASLLTLGTAAPAFAAASPSRRSGAGQAPKHVPASTPGNS